MTPPNGRRTSIAFAVLIVAITACSSEAPEPVESFAAQACSKMRFFEDASPGYLNDAAREASDAGYSRSEFEAAAETQCPNEFETASRERLRPRRREHLTSPLTG